MSICSLYLQINNQNQGKMHQEFKNISKIKYVHIYQYIT